MGDLKANEQHSLYFYVGANGEKTFVKTSTVNSLHGNWNDFDYSFGALNTYDLPANPIRTGEFSASNSNCLFCVKNDNNETLYELRYGFFNVGANPGFNVIEIRMGLFANNTLITSNFGQYDIFAAYCGAYKRFTQSSSLSDCIMKKFAILPPMTCNYEQDNFTPTIRDYDEQTVTVNGSPIASPKGAFSIMFLSESYNLAGDNLNNNSTSGTFLPRYSIPAVLFATNASAFTGLSDARSFVEWFGTDFVESHDWTLDPELVEQEGLVDAESSYDSYYWQTGDPTYIPTLTELNTNTLVGAGIHNAYKISYSSLSTFMKGLLDPTFIDSLKNTFSTEPLEGVISFKRLPFSPQTSGTSPVTIGTYTVSYGGSDFSANVIEKQYQMISCGEVYIQRKFGNFLDQNPYTKMRVYLPFVGIVDVDVDLWMGREYPLGVTYVIDVITGDFMVYLTGGAEYSYVVNTQGSSSLYRQVKANAFYQFDGNMSDEIPLSSSNKARQYAGIIGNGLSAVVDLATKDFGGAINDVSNLIASQKDHINIQGRYKPSSGWCSILKPHVILDRPSIVYPDDYGSICGYPCSFVETLSNLTGKTVVDEINLTCSATAAEKDEIERLLKEGVII